jgi:lipopolysaccharide transport system ATP-binding protein
MVPGRVIRRAGAFPTFLLIGAQRSGTTSLFHDLTRHPHVKGSRVKEVHFFDHEYQRGLDWYRTFFPPVGGRRGGVDVVVGEATPYYLFHPAVPQRVAETAPDIRLLVILRDPVDRAYSHYRKSVARRIERLSFEDALATEEGRLAGEERRLLSEPGYRSFQHRHHSYVARGLYAEQLERWLLHFSREQLLILRAEDFFARPRDTYARTLDFLGIAPFDPGAFSPRNPTTSEPLDGRVRTWLEGRFEEPNARLAELLGGPMWWPADTPGASG